MSEGPLSPAEGVALAAAAPLGRSFPQSAGNFYVLFLGYTIWLGFFPPTGYKSALDWGAWVLVIAGLIRRAHRVAALAIESTPQRSCDRKMSLPMGCDIPMIVPAPVPFSPPHAEA
jgi:hypothetical protein